MLDRKKTQQLPLVGVSSEDLLATLSQAREQVKERWTGGLFGKPDTPPKQIAIDAVATMMPVNANNSGVQTRSERSKLATERRSPWQATRDIERTLVNQVIDLFGGQADEFDGYVSSGGSESNLHAMWIGRNVLRNLRGYDEPIVIVAPNTVHNSIAKAADILDLARHSPRETPVVGVDLNSSWQLDPEALDEQINELVSNGIKKAIVVLNAGSTLNGICDETDVVSNILAQWETKADFQSFLHVDAAFGGWVLPFMKDRTLFHRFMDLGRNPRIATINVCFHKMALCPYDAGILLIRQPFLDRTRREVSNLTVGYEYTIRGSRSGATACGVWATINSVGRTGYEEIVSKCIALRDTLYDELAQLDTVKRYPLGHINICPIGLSEKLEPHASRKLRDYFEDCFIHPGVLSRRHDLPNEEVFAIHPMPHHTEADFGMFVDKIHRISE